jgi:hypothetical protein
MVGKFGIAWILGIGLLVSASTAFAFGPVNSVQSSAGVQRDLLQASFFGRPYPYGFTNWGPCVRYVEVETRWGLRLRRVNVCH